MHRGCKCAPRVPFARKWVSRCARLSPLLIGAPLLVLRRVQSPPGGRSSEGARPRGPSMRGPRPLRDEREMKRKEFHCCRGYQVPERAREEGYFYVRHHDEATRRGGAGPRFSAGPAALGQVHRFQMRAQNSRVLRPSFHDRVYEFIRLGRSLRNVQIDARGRAVGGRCAEERDRARRNRRRLLLRAKTFT